ncbi:hypothetical protein [Myceligenerans indicum]|uniref:DUF1499 domain-containing protein n=1 Tax=Myceligenerans indicum TaxID=2593663 RepID=A0ABS1LH09_9MICO|nr:hypothetical protein [Myceligenerans indicum]MBL0885428.1 hypothetical protein [Myceligenerans indicum]
MDARARKILFVVALAAFAVFSVYRLARMIQLDRVEGAAIWVAVLLLLAVCVLTVAAVLRRVSGLAAHVGRQRAGATVVPAFTTAETLDEARAAGASSGGWLPVGGSPISLAVLPDRVEVWARKEQAPRWSIQRTPGAAQTASGTYGSRTVEALRVSDGVSAVTVVPAYRPLRAAGGFATDDVARAVEAVRGG